MPNLESLVTSRMLSQQLKEAGCPQESVCSWYRLRFLPEYLSDDPWAWHVGRFSAGGPDRNEPSSEFEFHYSAYTAQEALSLLPKGQWQVESTYGGFRFWYRDDWYTYSDVSLAEMAGQAVIVAKEKGVI